MEIAANKLAVFLNYGYWLVHSFSEDELGKENKDEILKKIREAWLLGVPDISLPLLGNKY